MGEKEMVCPKCGNRDLNYFSVGFFVEACGGINVEKLEELQREGKVKTQMKAWTGDTTRFLDETTIPKFLYYLLHKKLTPTR